MVKLNPLLKTTFKVALSNYHQSLWRPPLSGEIDFIDQTVASFQNLNISAGKQSLKTRSKRIHLTPQVEYFRSTLISPLQSITVELADLLFIYKHFLNGVLDAYRAVIVQAKYTKGTKKAWKIDTDQFYFLTQWPTFRIVRPAFKKSFSVKPRTLTWAVYGFVGSYATKYPLYYSSERMLRQRTSLPSSSIFSYGVQTPIGWDSSTSFLLKFVQGFAGENLMSSSTVRAFVNDLYVIAKWKPDPPGELEWESENEEREGFGIVEFTVSTERGEQ